ncbi:hypothetical protein ABZ342_20355 [Amycolatopsis sp. NPDC005961]|uniref:hypothetical protein n=1 Tax=Amycolatopsis sp. NPDC005961 TaxID=3156720 RepID=UPI0033E83020
MRDVLWPFTIIGGVVMALGLVIAIAAVADRRDASTEGKVGITFGIFKFDGPARIVLALLLVVLGFAGIVFSFFHTKIEDYVDAKGKPGQSEQPRWIDPATTPASPLATTSTPPTQPRPSSSTPPPAPPGTTTPTSIGPPAPRDFVTTTVRTDGGEAEVFVGKRAAIMDHLRDSVTFSVDPGDAPDICVETVVSSGHSGSNVTLVAGDLGVGWPAAEAVPSPQPQGSAGFVHQQMVGLPGSATAGVWQMSIHLDENGASRTLGTVTISHDRASNGSEHWGIDGEAANCT